MMNIWPQTSDIQDGTPDLRIVLIVEAMERTEDMTTYDTCEYCGSKIKTKGLTTFKLINASELKKNIRNH